jgi:uncharacterized membrane protein
MVEAGMAENMDLKNTERRIYLFYHKDGLWDIFLGLFLIVSGLLFHYDSVGFIAILPGAFLPLVIAVKISFAGTRLARVKFSNERQARVRKNYIILLPFGIFCCLAGIFAFYAVS